jgi:hypothetical protein
MAIVDRAGGLRTMVDHHSIASAGLLGLWPVWSAARSKSARGMIKESAVATAHRTAASPADGLGCSVG